jgi:hypothetical protein
VDGDIAGDDRHRLGCGSHTMDKEGDLSVEELFVQWWLKNAAVSNIELAHLSNVSRRWRRAALHAIVLQAQVCLTEEMSGQRHDRRRLLLLPSMARFLMSQNTQGAERSQDVDGRVPTNDLDSFCAAWFHPDGIQEERISLNGKMASAAEEFDEEEEDATTLANSHHSLKSKSSLQIPVSTPFVPSGGDGQTYARSDDDNDNDDVRSRGSRKELQRDSQRSRSPAVGLQMQQQQHHSRSTAGTNSHTGSSRRGDDGVATCEEWRGYYSATQVLNQFGYSSSFVRDVLSSVLQSDDLLGIEDGVLDNIESASQRSPSRRIRDPTFAVRGAVIARPESYCYCVDSDVERLRGMRSSAAATKVSAGAPSGNTPYATSTDTDEYSDIRMQEYKQSLLRKERRRRELQRDVLPRILTRVVVLEAAASSKESDELAAVPLATTATTRSVQFLNASGSHAVCMMTPPFFCGPIPEPVTICCVGIATEDGCFLSGLHRRFELGHLYPNDEVAEATELSPVCLSTECGDGMADNGMSAAESNHGSIRADGDASMDTSNNTRGSAYAKQQLQYVRKVDDDADDDDEDDVDNDGDSSCDGSEDELASSQYNKCSCVFHGVGEKVSALDEEQPRRIHRGRLGPGMWHCYVAVFDGDSSVIRIDGVAEPMHSDIPANCSTAKAFLDGLTIGSDHSFGMSLCCGNGSGGEGEGAIAELAVFQGRLELPDLQVMERAMMERHGIQTMNSGSIAAGAQLLNSLGIKTNISDMVWRENEWARQAHALFFLSDFDGASSLNTLSKSTKAKNKSEETPPRIPLRFLSRHRSVAWKQRNPVTGEEMSIKRIGCKAGASSSDLESIQTGQASFKSGGVVTKAFSIHVNHWINSSIISLAFVGGFAKLKSKVGYRVITHENKALFY